ncbi:MAG: glutamine--fructose-6-phosphate transaminase (isomerizing) [Peptococcaceae bacterium]|jgi:glucosamine--fructose-6-phosphate aminotransferase (isomerizing)|nr:glutamine--fructose-6-phosphate transaminase (isomerizing) [Peptococcaceae bacterium]MDH7525915.1 glutamine--fructose-6-phosphate transaminase (isomerizing) [Peptococcaceae bacterium]
MCGIVGYIGPREATPLLISGLKKLEYRGYDSAGVAVIENHDIRVIKTAGKLSNLEKKLEEHMPEGKVGIGHTRWATHGRPSDVNSHPHQGCSNDFAVVHNGIIENYLELKEWLINERGHVFASETDTEVIAHLVEEFYQGDLVESVRKTLEKVQGSYAIGVISVKEPDKLVAARKDSPLIVGLGESENFIASDIPAILNHTRNVYLVEDGEVVLLTEKQAVILDKDNRPVERPVFYVEWDAEAAEKGGYEHFMLKEIMEQPEAFKKTLTGRIQNGRVKFNELNFTREQVEKWKKIFIVACGTAYHSGLIGKPLVEDFLRVPVEVDIASEFRYREPLVDSQTLAVFISQSGETADTLAALREAKNRGAATLAITNVVGSSISREADYTIYLWAGPEIAVASTKAYTTMLIAQYLLSVYLAQVKGTIPEEKATRILDGLLELPGKARQILDEKERLHKLAESIKGCEHLFFIGRGYDYNIAQEGALKLKEISYIHAEAYAAGELKHGTLALVTEETPVIAIALQEKTYEKTLSNIKEVIARDAYVIGLANEGDTEILKTVNNVIYIPKIENIVSPVLAIIPLQLLAYYAAVVRGCNVDQPRNLAKSVTVE